MDDDEIIAYVQHEYRRLAALHAEPGDRTGITARPGAAEPPGMTVLPGSDVPQRS